MKGWYIDIETDDLYLKSTKIWYMKLKTFDGERSLSLYPFRDKKEDIISAITEWIESFDDGAIVAGHNILGFDLWAIWKLLGIKPLIGKGGKSFLAGKEVEFIDTFVLSMFINPDSPKHSLEYLSGGDENEDGKINYRNSLIEAGALSKDSPKGEEFKFFHELMVPYCDRDADAGIIVLRKLWRKAQEMYQKEWVHKSFRQMQKDYWLYSAQAYSGVKFHKERAEELVSKIEGLMKELKDEVDPLLPPRPLKTAEQAYYKFPAKPFKTDGTLSATMEKWLVKHNATINTDNIVYAYGKQAELKANEIFPVTLPMEIDDNMELKDWFISQGWEASDGFWNFKKDPKTNKNMRDEKGKLIPTTPKIQNQGVICPNLLALEGEIPKKVVKYLSYRNRLGVVKGWLENWRIPFDGRLSAEISGYAPTSRVKHRTVDFTSRQ